MRKISILLLLGLMFFGGNNAFAQAKQNRGLHAFVNKYSSSGNVVQVSWRMRATDDPVNTKYLLYANGRLVKTLTSCTYAQLNYSLYKTARFSLEVVDGDGNVIDRQDNVKVANDCFVDIKMKAPAPIPVDETTSITYTPGDCSAYDMDGDGEQEIIMKWMPSMLVSTANNTTGIVGREFFDCYKLDGTLLWRLDMGQNVGAGNNLPFMCWDFDGDGKGELIVKTAPGSKDVTGKYVGEGIGAHDSQTSINGNGYADREIQYYRGSDGLPTRGAEWVTCYSWEGKELKTIDYWPYFSIQSNWYPGGNDTYTYGRRGCGFKGDVIFIPVDGERRPCCYMQRGVYSYVYGMALSWDGKDLKVVWKHTSDKQGEGLFAEGAHTPIAADIDGDGYDEVAIGAAALDHDGTVLWRTGLGHGDATHVGEFNPDNEGLEVWRITEGATKYDACMLDGKTGNVLNGQLYTSGDVGRGLVMDLDAAKPGNEYFHMKSGSIFDCNGNAIYTKNMGKNNGYPNYRIYWDGDLTDEHLSGNVVSKYSLKNQIMERCSTPTSGTSTLWSLFKVCSINDTKDNPCLLCDLFGDWREEVAMYVSAADAGISTKDYDFALRILTSTFPTQYKLPWLRDDHNYDIAIACQNVGYSMPPHLGYNPVEYNKWLEEQIAAGVYEMPCKNAASSVPVLYINANGALSTKPFSGFNIVKYADGTTRKVVF